MEIYKDKRVLITGGIGFIGSNLALRLVELGAQVTLVDSMLPAYGATLLNIEPIKDKVHVNFSDVRDSASLSYIVQGQDVIFSLAGQISHIDSMCDPLTDMEINCRSQLSLLECCRLKNPEVAIVFASTRQVYGQPRVLPVSEEHPLIPVDVNGINNLAAEMYYSLYHKVYGMSTVSLRLTNTYGPRMDLKSDTKGFVGIFVRKALRGETIEIYGTGNQLRDFNYVDDVVDALILAGSTRETAGKALNIGHPEPKSLLEFVEILRKFTEFTYEMVPFPPEIGIIDIGDYYSDFHKFHELTGWNPRIDLAAGLEKTVKYYQEIGYPAA